MDIVQLSEQENHFMVKMRINQGYVNSTGGRIELMLFLIPSRLSLSSLLNSSFPLVSALSFPVCILNEPFFCPVVYITLETYSIPIPVYSPIPSYYCNSIDDILDSDLGQRIEAERSFLSCIKQCSVPLLEDFFSTHFLTPHLRYLQERFNKRITHPFFSVSSCHQLLQSTQPTFLSALLLRVVMDLHFPSCSLEEAMFFRKQKDYQTRIKLLFSDWLSLLHPTSTSESLPSLEVESIDDSVQKVKKLEVTLPPCAKTYLTISAEYLELGKMTRCFAFYRKFASSEQKEKEYLLQDTICNQLIHLIDDMMSFVQSIRRLLDSKQNSLVLSKLTDYHGPLTHYLIYFKLLLRCILENHDTEIGWDVVKLIFPNLSMNGKVAPNWFEINRQTLKYYKSVNLKLIYLSLCVLCQLGKYETVIQCIAVLPEKSTDIQNLLDFAKSLHAADTDDAYLRLSQSNDSLACYQLMSEIYRRRTQTAMENHDDHQALHAVELALNYNPQDTTNYYLHACILRSLKRPLEAITSLEQSLEHRSDEKNRELLFELCLQIGDLEKAKEVFSVVPTQLVQLESLLLRAHRLLLMHHFSDCIPLLQVIRNQSPYWRSAFLDLLRCYVFTYKSKEAYQLLSSQCKWVSNLNEKAVLITGLVEPNKEQNEFDEMLVYLTLLVYWQMNMQRELMALYRLAKKHSVLSDLSQLLDVCERYQQLDLEGTDLMTSGDVSQALSVFSSIHQLLETVQNKGIPIGETVDNSILLAIGSLEMKAGKVERAIASFDKVIQSKFAYSPIVFRERAKCFILVKQPAKAIADLKQYMQRTGDTSVNELILQLTSDSRYSFFGNLFGSFRFAPNMDEIPYDPSYGALKSKYEECCDLLGVKTTDSPEVIRKRFKTLALQYHPDKNPDSDAEKKFIEIRNAYDYIMKRS